MAWESEASDAVPEVYEDSTVTSGPPTQRAQKEEKTEALDLLEISKAVRRSRKRGILLQRNRCRLQVVSTAPFQKFSEEVQRLFEEASRYNNCELDVRTYFDLQGYNLESFACRTKKQPGSLLMMYMFYSRIFEKLVGKQKGVEVALFSPVDFEERLLGFRAVLEWAKDFKMMPQRGIPRMQVKLNLHNAYRDVHFWKLSDGADFEKEARAAEMRARPHYEVATLEIDSEVPAARRYLDRFTWSNPDHIWEEFEAPFLDMGTCFLNRPPRRFKLEVYNRGLVLARLQMELLGTGPLRAPWHDCMLGPGQRVTVPIDIKASEPGEWHGYIRIRGAWVNVFGVNEEEARIPTHLKVERADCGPCGPPQLPVHAPRPFRPGSANRIRIDPSSLHTQQLRTPTPHKLKRPCSSSSASSAKPESARPVSSRNGSTAVPSSRPLSALGPPSSRCLAAKRVWGDQCDGQFGMIWI
ncbi:Pentatricopeptide repeat-containing protein [Durusdinium trenchii]|uniref:Chloroplastic n=1 Tax=Durusdinium trenchii TaxID=1381693 RepID=A0ABP0JWY9_9DINO